MSDRHTSLPEGPPRLELPDRRRLLSLMAAAPAWALMGQAGGAEAQPAAGQSHAWRQFEVEEVIDIPVTDQPVQLWAPLIQSAPAYQRVAAARLESDGHLRQVRDPRYHAAIAQVSWDRPGPRTLKLTRTVATRDRGLVAATLSPLERQVWLAPTASLPTDGIVRQTAERIVAGRTEPRQKLRAIYDWVVENTFRDPQARGCGIGDVKSLLETGRLGGKCADINSLMVALSRSAGIPARDVYGIRVGPSAHHKCLGATGDVSHAQHCRAEMWLEGEGWFPVDPADVRKVVLEEKAPVDSPMVRAERERLFGSWEMNWVGYNSATDIQPPGAPRRIEANFLMYPYAMTPTKDLDWLDPAAFRYAISAREIMA